MGDDDETKVNPKSPAEAAEKLAASVRQDTRNAADDAAIHEEAAVKEAVRYERQHRKMDETEYIEKIVTNRVRAMVFQVIMWGGVFAAIQLFVVVRWGVDLTGTVEHQAIKITELRTQQHLLREFSTTQKQIATHMQAQVDTLIDSVKKIENTRYKGSDAERDGKLVDLRIRQLEIAMTEIKGLVREINDGQRALLTELTTITKRIEGLPSGF